MCIVCVYLVGTLCWLVVHCLVGTVYLVGTVCWLCIVFVQWVLRGIGIICLQFEYVAYINMCCGCCACASLWFCYCDKVKLISGNIYIGLSSKYRSDDDDDFADRGTVRASGAADHLYRKQVSRFALQKRHTVHLAVHLAHQCSRSRRAHAA